MKYYIVLFYFFTMSSWAQNLEISSNSFVMGDVVSAELVIPKAYRSYIVDNSIFSDNFAFYIENEESLEKGSLLKGNVVFFKPFNGSAKFVLKKGDKSIELVTSSVSVSEFEYKEADGFHIINTEYDDLGSKVKYYLLLLLAVILIVLALIWFKYRKKNNYIVRKSIRDQLLVAKNKSHIFEIYAQIVFKLNKDERSLLDEFLFSKENKNNLDELKKVVLKRYDGN